jgi:MFS family permease
VPAAVISTTVLIPALLNPGLPTMLVLFTLAGAGASFAAPLNAIFVRKVGPEYRGRAMGVAASALLGAQGIGFLVAGGVVQGGLAPSTVTRLSGAIGTASVLGLSVAWRRAVAADHRRTAPTTHAAAYPPRP